MSPYPTQLTDLAGRLVKSYLDADMIQNLVMRVGGSPEHVSAKGKPSDYMYAALVYLYGRPAALLRLGWVLNEDDYWRPELGVLLGEVLDAGVGDGTIGWPPGMVPLPDLAQKLSAVFPDSAAIRAVGRASELSRALLDEQVAWYDPDPVLTWRTLLVASALEDKLPAVIAEVRRERAGDPVVQSLVLRAPAAEQAQREPTRDPVAQSAALRAPTAGEQSAGHGPVGHGQLEQNRAVNRVAAQPKPAPPDAMGSVKLAVQRSAVEALENLRVLMDDALARFGRADASEGVSAVPSLLEPDEYADLVNSLADDVDTAVMLDLGETALVDGLHALIAAVLAGMDVAQERRDYGVVDALAGQAAGAYEKVAKALGGEQGEILLRVVPYWRMKAAHARHEEKVLEQRKRLASAPTDLAPSQNPAPSGGGRLPTMRSDR